MSDTKGHDLGLSEAHTQKSQDNAPPRDAAENRDPLANGVARLAAMLTTNEAEQTDLLDGALDLGDKDPLSMVAETFAAPRRARGRPKGSTNLRNTQVFDYMEAIGHRDPAMTLSLIQTAPVHELAIMLGCDRLDAMKIQISAAKELLPYKYAKKPTDITVTENKTHLFVSADIDSMIERDEGNTALSIFGDATEKDIQ